MASYKGQAHEDRQSLMEKEREKMMAEFSKERERIKRENTVRIGKDKFVTQELDVESQLKRDTIGLVNLDEFQRIREQLQEQKRREREPVEKQPKAKKRLIDKSKLSFGDEEEEDVSLVLSKSNKKKEFLKVGKDPTVDTSFLPDKEREEQERRVREELEQEWIEKQKKIKEGDIEVTFSYWDGSGHRKSVMCKKGDTIHIFLQKAKDLFPQLRGVAVDHLLFVKEDLILPHHYSFYDFIINQVRGKSGPLYDFDVKDDIRLMNDASVETKHTHAGKVVEKAWYERNKHIFPASKWEVYDPSKEYGKREK